MHLGIIAVALALVLLVGPHLGLLPISTLSILVLNGFGLIMLIVGAFITAMSKFYRNAPMDEAFVRTGLKGGKLVVMDGGALVLPKPFHNVIPVTLQTMKFTVTRAGNDALITGDRLRADITAEFFIKIDKKEDDVIMAATRLGPKACNPTEIEETVSDKLVNALRSASATKTLDELHAKRSEFEQAVQDIVRDGLKHNGLSLEIVTISRLDQTALKNLNPKDNVFDAEGAKRLAQITTAANVETNQIKNSGERTMKEQDVQTANYVYQKEVEQAKAQAEKERDIQIAQSNAQQESATVAQEQEQLTELARVKKEQAVQQAELTKTQSLEVADQQRMQAAQVAQIEKERATEIANREKQVSVADAETKRAQAETKRLEAEVAKETQTQAVQTVMVTQAAERDKQKKVIEAEGAVAQTKLSKQMDADVTAYSQKTLADAAQQAAEKEAEAMRIRAQGQRDAQKLESEGLQALQMVPVTVASQEVKVEGERVEVKRNDLKNQADFESISRELQVQLAQIQADRDVEIERAKSFGVALSKAQMTIWGSPDAVQQMSQSFLGGQKAGAYVDGLTAGMSDPTKQLLGSALGNLGAMGAALVEKMTGKKVDPQAAQQAINELTGNAS